MTAMPRYGIFINGRRYRRDIEAKRKTEETRPGRTLDQFIDQTVGLIETGNGQRWLYAVCVLKSPRVYKTQEAFRKAASRHRVPEGSKYWIQAGGVKYGYRITGLKVLPEPVPIDSTIGNYIYCELPA